MYVNGEFVGGCDILIGSKYSIPRTEFCFHSYYLTSIRHTTYVLLSTVHQSGELETLLENNGVIPKIEEEAATATA